MSLTRKTKIWLIILGIPLVLVAAGMVALKVMFTSERLKSMVIPMVEETTGRPVTINSISLSVFPSIAVRMQGVSIANRKGEGFSANPFLALDVLRLNVKLLPLLKSRVEVTSLELDRPHLLLEVNARNETNYRNLLSGRSAEASGSPTQNAAEPPPAAAFLISGLQVNNGSFDYVNYRDNSSTRIRNLLLATEVGGEGNTVVISGNATTDSLSYGTVETPMLAGLRLRLDHRMLYDISKDVLRIEKGDMVLQNIRLVLSGAASHLKSNPVLDLAVGSDSVNIADLLSIVPTEYMKKAEGAKGTGIAQVSIAITGTLTDSTSSEYAGTITAKGATLRFPQVPKPITDITILSSFTNTKTKQEFRLENLAASLGGAPISMAMTVTDFDDPYLKLSAGGSLNLAHVGEFYPLDKGTELAGEMKLDLRIVGKVIDPKTMQASGTMTFRDVSAKTATSANPVRKLSGTVTFNNEIAETKKLSLLIGESDMTIACRVKNYLSLVSNDKKAPQSSVTMSLRSNHIFTRDLLSESPAQGSSTRKAGDGRTAADKSGSQESGQSVPPKTGKSGGKSASAVLPMDLDVNATIGTLTLEKFEFTGVLGSLRISKGVVTMQNLTLNTFGGSVSTRGTLDLNRPDRPVFDLNLNLNALEASSLLSQFTSFGQRLSGAMSMNASMKGELNDTLGLVPAALEGNGKVGVKNGSLKGFKVNQSLAGLLNLPELETMQFSDWENDFTVQNGRLVIKDLTITALDAQYVVNGSQGLDGTLDYRMALYLPESAGQKLNIPGFGGEAINLFKDQSGRLKLDFNVGGTTDDPKVQLDTDSVRKRAEETLKDKVGDALKKLFKKNK